MKKQICILLVLALMISSTSLIFADSGKSSKGADKEKKSTTQGIDKELKKVLKKSLNEEKAALVVAKDQLEAQKDQLETDIEAALAAGNAELAAQLQAEFNTLAIQFWDAKNQIKAVQDERKQLVLGTYSEEELAALKEAAAKIESLDPAATPIEVSAILSEDVSFKFDTPPVIKGNRTLIPVRAITEGLGAQVTWDPETEQVTIVKEQTTITLTLGNNTAIVNGEEVTLDTKAGIMNNRTYVPMRFIMETFKLNVDYDDGTIEVDDPTDDATSDDDSITEDETVTDGGIVTDPAAAITAEE